MLWLNPGWASAEVNEKTKDALGKSTVGTDGLRIYDETSAGKLFSQGVSVYPSAHSDFLSRSSNLAIDLQVRCNVSNSEFIQRIPNRMVVVRSRKLCTFLTPGKGAVDSELMNEQSTFDESTMLALVIVLSATS